MCVIVTSEQGQPIPDLMTLTAMTYTNPDGTGIAWYGSQGLHVYHTIDPEHAVAWIINHRDMLTENPCLIHFRLATHGQVSHENTHPFTYQLDNGETGYIAHNGIARPYTDGIPYANDSRNAIHAWQTGADTLRAEYGYFARLTNRGTILWNKHPTSIPTEWGTYQVSNTYYEINMPYEPNPWLLEDEYEEEDEYDTII